MGLIKDVQQEEYNSCIDQAWAKTMLATSSKSAFCRWSQEVNICFAFAFSNGLILNLAFVCEAGYSNLPFLESGFSTQETP